MIKITRVVIANNKIKHIIILITFIFKYYSNNQIIFIIFDIFKKDKQLYLKVKNKYMDIYFRNM